MLTLLLPLFIPHFCLQNLYEYYETASFRFVSPANLEAFMQCLEAHRKWLVFGQVLIHRRV